MNAALRPRSAATILRARAGLRSQNFGDSPRDAAETPRHTWPLRGECGARNAALPAWSRRSSRRAPAPSRPSSARGRPSRVGQDQVGGAVGLDAQGDTFPAAGVGQEPGPARRSAPRPGPGCRPGGCSAGSSSAYRPASCKRRTWGGSRRRAARATAGQPVQHRLERSLPFGSFSSSPAGRRP